MRRFTILIALYLTAVATMPAQAQENTVPVKHAFSSSAPVLIEGSLPEAFIRLDTVLVRVQVNTLGQVTQVVMVGKPSNYDPVCLDGARWWQFKPAWDLDHHVPVPMWITVPVYFMVYAKPVQYPDFPFHDR